MNNLYELTLNGFYGGTDATADLILWIQCRDKSLINDLQHVKEIQPLPDNHTDQTGIDCTLTTETVADLQTIINNRLHKPARPVKKVCPHCGSTNIVNDAFAQWNIEKQDWVLCGLLDDASCNDCGKSDIEIEEKPIEA